MKLVTLIAVLFTFVFTLVAADAEAARRLGGGKSSGMQKQMTTPDKAPTSAPAAAPGVPTKAAAAPGAPASAPAAAPSRSWLGPVAGLAAGLGLAALASHLGFGEEMASLLMIGLLVFAVLAVIGFVMRRKAGSTPAFATAGAMAGASGNPGVADSVMQRHAQPAFDGGRSAAPYASGNSTAPVADASAVANLPAEFDVAGFERAAKVNFIRLQAAHDAGNLEDIRQFTTPEMFGELSLAIAERGGAAQQSDVLNIDAKVLEVSEEELRYVASVRFTGLVRENGVEHPDSVDEVWHLVKARNGGGWQLAGIQQLA